ncbi:SAM-dependent methyltransferase [Shewanella sp. AS1]|uniref:methyltransferase n=1 Tax=Shewanella sp. AS1 TaxID=2907626 RepID=UPI001F317C88|nr:methyltransferase [Shewanella sp. AS1]MCE9678950.1 SAM-dependent methyltransferase [Shewanella sp. AS1]
MAYQAQMQLLDKLLTASRSLWQVKAFESVALPWEAGFPALAACVWQINDDEIEAIDSDSQRLLETLLPALQQDLKQQDLQQQDQQWPLELLSQYTQPATTDDSEHEQDNDIGLNANELPHFSAHIKGRKWQQIVAFAQRLKETSNKETATKDTATNESATKESANRGEVLEWCAGKGHLGRLLAKAQQRKVVSLEWQQALCDAGDDFAKRWALSQRFICGDAFDLQVASLFKADQQVVALHACGDLHIRMLRHATAAKTACVALSPCCYHLIEDKHYQGLSSVAKGSELKLSRHDLQLPLQQSVIANDKARELRLQEIAWRLGFDSLQRKVRGCDHYLPVPSIKQSQLSGSFRDFCLWAAAQKQLALPESWSAEDYLQQGLSRQRLTRRIDLVAHLFRDCLEQWLLLDRVCYLEEAGYQVELSQFCPKHITPRNGFILANRKNG